ncbi:MAG: hypothetical protein FWD46_09655, partial [Cystobacterineae bacterium]|nr:hypothetical protein [Cystobacterineae bacterium]
MGGLAIAKPLDEGLTLKGFRQNLGVYGALWLGLWGPLALWPGSVCAQGEASPLTLPSKPLGPAPTESTAAENRETTAGETLPEGPLAEEGGSRAPEKDNTKPPPPPQEETPGAETKATTEDPPAKQKKKHPPPPQAGAESTRPTAPKAPTTIDARRA